MIWWFDGSAKLPPQRMDAIFLALCDRRHHAMVVLKVASFKSDLGGTSDWLSFCPQKEMTERVLRVFAPRAALGGAAPGLPEKTKPASVGHMHHDS